MRRGEKLLAVGMACVCLILSAATAKLAHEADQLAQRVEILEQEVQEARAEPAPPPAPEPEPEPIKPPPKAVTAAVEPKAPAPVEAAVIGNRNSKVYHKPSCDSVGKMKDANKVSFDSEAAAQSAGYKPCKRCHK